MKKKQTDRLTTEKVKGQGPKEIFGENAQKHDTLAIYHVTSSFNLY